MLIPMEVYDEIQTKFDKVILHSQDYDEVNTDALFHKWYENKSWFLRITNGQLIYEVPTPVSFDLDEDEKKRRIGNFIETVSADNYWLADFLLKNSQSFYDNKVLNDYVSESGKVIPKGMKISRAFKFFETDKEKIDKWQIKMSMMLQEDKITGTLCFSVHPLDFLSASENTYNWRSCHALDGDYRAGNLSYMCDKSTIICYLKGAEDAFLPRFPHDVPWNNKKWRMLLFFSDCHKALFAGRQYPFFSREALDIVLSNLSTLIDNHSYYSWEEWTNKRITNFDYGTHTDGSEWVEFLNGTYIAINGNLQEMKQLVSEPAKPLHFNDILYSSRYIPYYTWVRNRGWVNPKKDYHFTIGESVPCLRCGKEELFLSSSFLCYEDELRYGNCEDEEVFCRCDCCGERILIEDSTVLQSGERVCDSCLDTECSCCENCNEYVWNDQLYYDEEHGIYVCLECKYSD